MPSWAETRLALQGLLKLARFNPDFVRFFDLSRVGALRSFWVPAAIYPYLILINFLLRTEEVPSEGRYFAGVTVFFALNCFILPVVLLALAPMLQRVEEALGCISVYNWSGLLMVVIDLPFLAVDHMDLSVETQTNLLYLKILIGAAFEYFVIRHALRVHWQIAVGLTIADVYLTNFLILPMLSRAVLSG